MSILLEALRKSEKNQHLRETPTIHTENQPGPVSEPMPTRWLLLLLVVALLVTGWFVWRQYRQPAGSYQPPVTLEKTQAPAVDLPAAADKPPARTVPSPPSTSSSTGQNRTPVESYKPPANAAVPPGHAPPGHVVNSTGINHSKAGTDGSTLTTQTDPNETGPKQTGGAGLREPVSEAAVDKPVEPSEQAFHPGEPAPISYWELPDSVRADIPEIKFSVLVYAVKPADRFVLINGQRLAEGDTAQPGLVVKEIRRDGVVFSYRLYQFLVEK